MPEGGGAGVPSMAVALTLTRGAHTEAGAA